MDIERYNFFNEIEVEMKKKQSFEKFKAEFSAVLKKRHGIEIGDCTDEDQLKQAYQDETATEYVERVATKYDLNRIDLFFS